MPGITDYQSSPDKIYTKDEINDKKWICENGDIMRMHIYIRLF